MTWSPAVAGGSAALAASASWAISTVLFKAAIVRHGPRAMNAFRIAIALLLFWTSTLLIDGGVAWRSLATRDGGVLLLSGALGLAVGDVFLFEAVKRLGAQPAIALNQLSPIWSAALGFALGSESLGMRDLGGIAMVLGGVLLVIFGRAKRETTGASDAVADAAARRLRISGTLCGVVSSLCNATAGVMTHHAISAVGVLPGSTLRMSGAAVGTFLATLAMRRGAIDFAPLRMLPQMRRELVAVFLATFLGIFLQQAAYANLDASVALCLLSTTPLFLLPMAVGILHERYRWIAWFGTLLATAGVPLLLMAD